MATIIKIRVFLGVGVFLVDVVLIVTLFGTWGPLYSISGSSDDGILTGLNYNLWGICVYTLAENFCLHFDSLQFPDKFLNGEADPEIADFQTKSCSR